MGHLELLGQLKFVCYLCDIIIRFFVSLAEVNR